MATGVHVWSTTAASNSNSDSTIGWAEGQAPSTVNDSARALMAGVAAWRKDTAGTLTTAGTSTAYTIAAPNATYASLTELDGVKLKVKFNATNGAAPTLNVNSLGAKAIQTAVGTAVATGAILANSIHDVTYDNANTAFILSGAFTGAWAYSGNVTVGGTLGVTGAATLSSTLGVTGDVAVNTNKFTVAASSGNTVVAGTLGVTGAATLSSALGVTGDVAVNTNKFTVTASSGNTLVAGTLAVTGASTLTGVLTARIGLLHVREEQAANTQGGTFTSGAWRTRTLNTVKTNEIGASLGSNQITLLAGTYEVEASAPAFTVFRHKAKLVDVTNVVDLVIGTSENGNSGDGVQTASVVRGRFTLAGTAAVELQHQCSTTASTQGLGVASNFGVVEVYSEVMILKVV